MSAPFFGIDIGTGSCSVAYVIDDPRVRDQRVVPVKVVPMPVDGEGVSESDRMPSLVGVDWTNRARRSLLFGWDFLRPFTTRKESSALLRRGVDYLSSFKSDMGTHKVYPRSRMPGIRTPAQATAAMLDRLAEAVKSHGYKLRDAHVTMTVPASFSSIAREETLCAAEAAGLKRALVELIDEPVAALLDLLNDPAAAEILTERFRNVLVFDYGAGTCDLSLVQARFNAYAKNGLEVKNLAISPYRRLGGDDVDAAIMEHVVWPQLLKHDPHMARATEQEKRAIEDTLTPSVARGLKEKICKAIERKTRAGQRVKPDLAETYPNVCRFQFDTPARMTPSRFRITAGEFEQVMAPFLAVPAYGEDPGEQSLFGPVMETISRAGLTADDLDVLILHGGSSMNPLVEQMLGEQVGRAGFLFGGLEVKRTPHPLSSVARGAAVGGYWKHARGHEIVQPIVADEIGVVAIGHERKRLVAAGEPLPYPDDDGVDEVTASGLEFVVPEDADAELLVPVYTGNPEQLRIASTVKVPLPDGTVPGDPVRIKLRIDRDKTLHWWFSIGTRAFVQAESLHNPWTLAAPTRHERDLLEHRLQMRRLADAGAQISSRLELEEANYLRRAGRFDECLALTRDLVAEHGEHPGLANIEGLVHARLGRDGVALACFKRAVELAPSNAVLVGNYGSQLADVNDLDGAVAALKRAIAINPELAYVHAALADVFRRQGDEPSAERELTQAAAVLQRAMAERPLDPDLLWELARVRDALGEYHAAEEARSAARELERNALVGGDSNSIIASAHGRKSWRSVR